MLELIKASQFPTDFEWGVATAAAQIEGAADDAGRGLSIWDKFSERSGKTKNGATPAKACQFYYRYSEDLLLAKWMGFKVFRFSISWSRIFPNGKGYINQEGVQFYHRLIQECLHLKLTPYITLYHWDLPWALEKEGGWTSPLVVSWFKDFATFCAREYGSKVKNWIVLNEPAGFTTLGYMTGQHAPGRMGLTNYLPAIKHTLLAQAAGANALRKYVIGANIGTSFSFSEIIPASNKETDIKAAERVDTILNRLFVEPAIGKGLPTNDFPLMEQISMYCKPWRNNEKFSFDFDFIGIQKYFPITIKHHPLIPYLQATDIKASSRKVPHTALGWEINADSFYRLIMRVSQLAPNTNLYVTENGAYFKDILLEAVVNDQERIEYFQQYLGATLQSIKDGANLKGYFAWTLTDNFEWAEGYQARFGLVHINFKTQKRTIKNSGHWWQQFLKS
ncbi:MAG: hypothetical protein RLY16_1710 [Bacteroidota bacterium]|jgi:beta-glucosidase